MFLFWTVVALEKAHSSIYYIMVYLLIALTIMDTFNSIALCFNEAHMSNNLKALSEAISCDCFYVQRRA